MKQIYEIGGMGRHDYLRGTSVFTEKLRGRQTKQRILEPA